MNVWKWLFFIVMFTFNIKCRSIPISVKPERCNCAYTDSSTGRTYFDLQFSFCFIPLQKDSTNYKVMLGDQDDQNIFAGYARISGDKIEIISKDDYEMQNFTYQTLIDFDSKVGDIWQLKKFGILYDYTCTLDQINGNLYIVSLKRNSPSPSHGAYSFKRISFHKSEGVKQVSFNSPLSGRLINCSF